MQLGTGFDSNVSGLGIGPIAGIPFCLGPARQFFPGAVFVWVHCIIMRFSFSGQLDHVTVWIAEINGLNERVVCGSAALSALLSGLVFHVVQILQFDFQCDVHVEIVLVFELKRHAGALEKGHKAAIGHSIKGVQVLFLSASLGDADLQGLG